MKIHPHDEDFDQFIDRAKTSNFNSGEKLSISCATMALTATLAANAVLPLFGLAGLISTANMGFCLLGLAGGGIVLTAVSPSNFAKKIALVVLVMLNFWTLLFGALGAAGILSARTISWILVAPTIISAGCTFTSASCASSVAGCGHFGNA